MPPAGMHMYSTIELLLAATRAEFLLSVPGCGLCPAYQEIRSEFGELFDYCEGDLRKLMCHPKQHILAKLVHKMRVFRDEDYTECVGV